MVIRTVNRSLFLLCLLLLSGCAGWVKTRGGPKADEATAIAVNGSEIYVAGNFFDSLNNFSLVFPGQHPVILNYDRAGNEIRSPRVLIPEGEATINDLAMRQAGDYLYGVGKTMQCGPVDRAGYINLIPVSPTGGRNECIPARDVLNVVMSPDDLEIFALGQVSSQKTGWMIFRADWDLKSYAGYVIPELRKTDVYTDMAIDRKGIITLVGYTPSIIGRGNDILVVQLDANNNLTSITRRLFGGPLSEERVSAVAVDDDGNIYLAGVFQGAYFDIADRRLAGSDCPSSRGLDNHFILKLDAELDSSPWAAIISCVDMEIRAINVGGSTLGATGRLRGEHVRAGDLTIGSRGGSDAFLLRLGIESGGIMTAHTVGGEGDDVGNDLYIDRGPIVGGAYVVGGFQGVGEFNIGSSGSGSSANLVIQTETSHGDSDIFVWKF